MSLGRAAPPVKKGGTGKENQAKDERTKRVSLFQRSRSHQFGDEDDAHPLLLRNFPVIVEPDDVGVLKPLEHLGLLPKPLTLILVPLALLKEKRKRA